MCIRRSAFLLFLFICLPLFAQTPDPNRKTGFTFFFGTPDSGISVRRRVTPDWTVLGTLAYSRNGQAVAAVAGPAPNANATSWALGAGVRRVFVSEELRPFIEVDALLRRTDVPFCDHISYPYFTAAGGVEYFVAKRVSIEGSAGLSYSRVSERCTQDLGNGPVEFRFDSHSFGTFRSALSLTFWF